MTRHTDHVLFDLFRSAYLPLFTNRPAEVPSENEDYPDPAPREGGRLGKIAVEGLVFVGMAALLAGVLQAFSP